MNNVVLIGRLTKDIELRYTQSQMAVATFTLAVDRFSKPGEERKADFIRITVFGKQAENCDRYLSKGRQTCVQGRIQTGSYTNKDGQTVYTTDVVADRVEFIGGGSRDGGSSSGGSDKGFSESTNYADEFDADIISESFRETNDDVPF